MKKHLIQIFLLFFGVCYSQNGTLEGKVIDSETNEALIGVNIVIKNLSQSAENNMRSQLYGILGTATNFNGEFKIKNLTSGTYEIIASYIGYDKEIATIQINEEVVEHTFYLTKNSTEIDVVVISAGKFEQKLEEVTVSMDIIKPSIIENKNTVDLSELMNQSPGVQVIDGQANIRGGSGWSYNTGSRVLVMVDDMPLLSGDRGTVEWDMIPMENVSQIEVIKGASSVLFGSSALNGVINVRTAYPKGAPETNISVFSGFYDAPERSGLHWWGDDTRMFSGASMSYAQYKNNTGIIFGGNIYTNDGYKGGYVFNPSDDGMSDDGIPDMGNTAQDSIHSSFGKEIPVSEKWARFNFKIEKNSEEYPGLSFGIAANFMSLNKYEALIFANDTIGYTPIGVPEGDDPLLFTQWMYNIDPHIKYINPNNNTKHSYKGRFFKDDYRPHEDEEGYSTVLFQEYQFQKTFNMTHGHVVSTTGMSTNKIEGSYDDIYGGGGLSSRKEMANYSLYSQFDFKYKSLNLSFGGRLEHLRFLEETYNIPVMRGGLNLRLLPTTYLRGSFGQGYRFPTIMESFVKTDYHPMYIYPGTTNGPDGIFGNSDDITLKPEHGWSGEVGLKQLLKIGEWKGMFDVAVFRMHYNDMIEFTFGSWGDAEYALDGNGNMIWPPTSTNLYGIGFKCVNIGEAQISGIEGSLVGQGKIGNIDISLLAGYTYTVPIILEPNESYYSYVVNGDTLDLNYNTQDVNPNLLNAEGDTTIYPNPNYNLYGTSSDNSNQILKYRSQHVAKLDVQLKYKKYSTGLSARYSSAMQNMDAIFGSGAFNEGGGLDGEFTLENLGVLNSWNRNRDGSWIIDCRVGLQISNHTTLSLIIDNLFNQEYLNRPADLGPPRTFTFKLTGKI